MDNNSNQMPPVSSIPPVPPPVTQISGTRDVFTNIATMLSLGVMVGSFLMLVKLLVDTIMPDQFNCGCNFTWEITMEMAILIVSSVFYFYLSWRMRRDEHAVPLHHSSKFHQVVVYLALFLAGLSISYSIVDVLQTTFYYGFTLAVLIKLGFFVLVFGSIFIYYFADIKKGGDLAHSKLAIMFWWIVFALILGSIIGAFIVIGSPSFQKEKRFDEERLTDLQTIQSDIDYGFGYSGAPLPAKLSDYFSTDEMNDFLDPEFNQPYEYTATGANTYDLCANFGTSSNDYAIKLEKVYGGNAKNFTNPWAHEAGHTCFHLTVKQDTTNTTDYSLGE